jgi:hypothetical protein
VCIQRREAAKVVYSEIPTRIEGVMVNAPTRSWKNISGATPIFKLAAGLYELTVHAETWDGGSVTLQRLAADGSTTAFKSLSADGSITGYVPSGSYQLTITGAIEVSADLVLKDTF